MKIPPYLYNVNNDNTIRTRERILQPTYYFFNDIYKKIPNTLHIRDILYV